MAIEPTGRQISFFVNCVFSGWRRVHQTDLGSRHLLCQREDRALPPGVLQFARMELL